MRDSPHPFPEKRPRSQTAYREERLAEPQATAGRPPALVPHHLSWERPGGRVSVGCSSGQKAAPSSGRSDLFTPLSPLPPQSQSLLLSPPKHHVLCALRRLGAGTPFHPPRHLQARPRFLLSRCLWPVARVTPSISDRLRPSQWRGPMSSLTQDRGRGPGLGSQHALCSGE